MGTETMVRTALLLALATALHAKEPEIEAEPFDHFVYLSAGETVIHEMEAEAVEVHFLFLFRFGLYAIGPKGDVANATAGVRIEIDYHGKGFKPVFMQSDLNPDWNGPVTRPGTFLTRAKSNKRLERRIIVRFARKGRYRLRITGLLADTEIERRVPILTGVAEVRDLPLDVQHPWEEPPPRERQPVREETYREEQPEEEFDAPSATHARRHGPHPSLQGDSAPPRDAATSAAVSTPTPTNA